jgi:hypothetical protein
MMITGQDAALMCGSHTVLANRITMLHSEVADSSLAAVGTHEK